MTAIAIFLAVWSLVILAIILLLGRYLGRRPRTFNSLAAANSPAPREGDAHPGGEIRSTAASYPRSGAPRSDSRQPSMANPRRRGRSPWLEMTNPRTSSSPVTRSGDEAAHPVPSRDGGRAGSGCASNVPS